MPRKEKPQLHFFLDEAKGRLQVPKHFSELPHGNSLLDLLPEQKLFDKRPKGRLLFQDLSFPNRVNAVEPGSWQTQEIDLETGEKFAGAILVTPPGEQKGLLEIARRVFSAVLHIKPESPVFVFEERGARQEKGQREEILKEAGLVKRAVLTHPRGGSGQEEGILWRARCEKRNPPHKPVDLLAGPRGPWLRKVWREIIKSYQRKGFRVLSGEEMGNRLRHSTFAPLDISSLKLGFGVEVEAPCGCRWRINIHGTRIRERKCDNPGCNGNFPNK